MNDSQWDSKLKSFLKKTGEDFKRAGNDIKSEAEKLLKEVQDPDRQAKVKAGMKDFGTQARKAAEQMAELMETGVKKAEGVLSKATDKVADFTSSQKAARKPSEATVNPDPTPPNAPAEPSAPPTEAGPAAPARKSIGGSKRKPTTKKTTSKKKSLGKKAEPAGEEGETDE